jgi:hypothetical protein
MHLEEGKISARSLHCSAAGERSCIGRSMVPSGAVRLRLVISASIGSVSPSCSNARRHTASFGSVLVRLERGCGAGD